MLWTSHDGAQTQLIITTKAMRTLSRIHIMWHTQVNNVFFFCSTFLPLDIFPRINRAESKQIAARLN